MSKARAELVVKRAEIAGHLEALRAELASVEQDLLAVDRVLKLLDPSYAPVSERGGRRRAGVSAVGDLPLVFDRGALTAGLMEILREASGPVTARACAIVLAQSQGISPEDRRVSSLAGRVSAMLGKYADRGRVERIRSPDGREVRWRVALANGTPPFLETKAARGQR